MLRVRQVGQPVGAAIKCQPQHTAATVLDFVPLLTLHLVMLYMYISPVRQCISGQHHCIVRGTSDATLCSILSRKDLCNSLCTCPTPETDTASHRQMPAARLHCPNLHPHCTCTPIPALPHLICLYCSPVDL